MKNLRTLNKYLLKYKWKYLLGFLFVASSNFLTIFAIKYFADALNGLKEADEALKALTIVSEKVSYKKEVANELFFNAGMFIGLSILSGVFKYYQRQTIIVSSRKIEFDIRNSIFKQYTLLPFQFYKNHKIGDMMNRISEDVGNVRMYLGPGIMYLVNLLTLLIICSTFMLYYDWVLALVALIPLPILSFLIYKVTRTIYNKSLKVQQNQSTISSFVQDSFSGIRVIKSYAKEKFIYSKYDVDTENYKKSQLSLALTNSLFFPAISLIIGLTYVLIIYIGGTRLIEGIVSVGTLAAFFLFVQYLVWPFISLGWIVSLIQKAEASMQRINEFLKAETEENIEPSVEKIHGDIEFKNVSYTYTNTGITALDNLSFTLKENQTLAVFGKTGSGKSTIAMLLSGLILPNEGEISINHKNINTYSLQTLRNSIGYIPQESFLFSDTIYNNISFGMEQTTQEEVKKYAQKADVHENISNLNQQYQTKVGERGVTLSGGQKQRIAIARALIKDAPILIFDDALSAVDTETEENILQNIEEEFSNKTTIIISHRASSAKNADYILVIDDGKVLEYGTVKELLQQQGYFYTLYQKQLAEKELHV